MSRHLVVNGTKARQLRSQAKLTQQVAAVRVDLAVSSLRRIESGGVSVQLTTLGKLAVLYSVKPENLLKWEK
jgi:transcriptional regulator with XRE-family HTH domain